MLTKEEYGLITSLMRVSKFLAPRIWDMHSRINSQLTCTARLVKSCLLQILLLFLQCLSMNFSSRIYAKFGFVGNIGTLLIAVCLLLNSFKVVHEAACIQYIVAFFKSLVNKNTKILFKILTVSNIYSRASYIYWLFGRS